MLRAAIIERARDRREAVRSGLLEMNMDIEPIAFSNIYDFRDSMDVCGTSYDILLLNTTIHREGDGTALAGEIRRINRSIMICFITDSPNYYAEAFAVLATGYLLYPFNPSLLHNCISFYYHKTDMERRASWMVKESGGSYRRLFSRNITFIESSNREIFIHLDDGSVVASYARLSVVEENLSDRLFLRCHQSYIVNLYYVTDMERSRFHISSQNGKDDSEEIAVPISRRFMNSAHNAYYRYLSDKAD